MSSQNEQVRAEFMVACRHDVPDLAQLARERLPEMTYLHDEQSWRTYYRFGPGFHPRDNYLTTVRVNGDGPLLGFAWVDAAARADAEIDEPWWCINAVAVDARIATQGLGTQLVRMVKEQAQAAGVVSLYGITYPSSAGFWRKQGFSVGDLEQGLEADQPVRMTDGSRNTFDMTDREGNQLFAVSFGSAGDGAARLRLQGAEG